MHDIDDGNNVVAIFRINHAECCIALVKKVRLTAMIGLADNVVDSVVLIF